ncbi:MAG: hypothetical protein HYT80_10490 [Euryarchaeota archaeon]|nr:hypothetical protein [Euryarchaeota archaeon]
MEMLLHDLGAPMRHIDFFIRRLTDSLPALLGRLRSVAELSMLRAVSPRHAEMLTEVGIGNIRELSVAPPLLVAAALKELELKHVIQPLPGEEELFPKQCVQWTDEAKAFLAEASD